MSFLELNNITKQFGRLSAIEDIHLSVNEGEILGIVGPNGSGKSTLINVITSYYRPTRGDIFFEGRKISGLRPDKIAKLGIARTFQSNVHFENIPVLHSVLMSSYLQYTTNNWQSFFRTKAYRAEHKEIVGRILDILKMLGLFDDFEKIFLPAPSLSHGHQRMLGIAIALASGPKVLLLDEPTTGMNHEEAMAVVENIKKINEMNITVILIEHNMKVLLNLATRVAVLNFGTKIAEGKPEEVMNKQEVIEAYLGTETI